MITILNAKEHNLKSINLQLPDNKLIVVTGVSGSGKSSLVYDIIFNEARRRYIESFSSDARLFMGRMSPPNVQYLSGLSPAIALDQKSTVLSPKSTVGTLSEMYDLLRILFARLGKPTSKFPAHISINRSLFSFNTEQGACINCSGLGVTDAIDSDLLISHPQKTIRQGAFAMTTPNGYIVYSQVTMDVLSLVCEAEGFSVDIPWNQLDESQQKIVLYGSQMRLIPFGKHPLESRMKWKGITAKPREEGYYKGIVPVMEEILKRDRNPNVLRFAKTITCPVCKGSRLRPEVQEVYFRGRSIVQWAALTINELVSELEKQVLKNEEQKVAEPIIREIIKTGKLIQKLGLGFLRLNQSSQTLTGGETQRVRLAKLATSGLRNLLYVFDEPSMGMHPSEVTALLEVLFALRDQENTVILVEHHPLMIKEADWIVDLGPGAGNDGGYLLFSGKTNDFLKQQESGKSQTHKYLISERWFKTDHRKTNLFFDVELGNEQKIRIKQEAVNVITGTSASGKRTIIEQAFQNYQKKQPDFKIVEIDATPIGKTSRSNPATYIGLADELRNLFASQKKAKEMKFTANHFSFNSMAGSCPKCKGAGYEQVGMQWLGTVELLCNECGGKQFKPEVLEVIYEGKNISEIFALTIDQARLFFKNSSQILIYLEALQQLGLGYLTLNQRSGTLSGGEARRIKLARNLVKKSKNPVVYLFNEPSSGLHPFDIGILIQNLNQLVKQRHTIVMIDQNLEVILQADHLIELGDGSAHGKVVFQGNPKDIIDQKDSLIGKVFNEGFQKPSHQPKNVFEQKEPILLKGVTTHNLKHIDVAFPYNQMTALVGVSGSGKSSLAFDTLFMEGRQRYAESFSAYVRNRLHINSQAQIEQFSGLMPTLAVDQKSISTHQRSTVGTLTDIDNDIRLLFARIGKSEKNNEQPRASWFSFNHEQGACSVCKGLGYKLRCDDEKLISHPEKPITHGAMGGTKTGQFYGDFFGQYIATLLAVGKKYQVDYTLPWNQLSVEAKKLALYGSGREVYEVDWKYKRKNREGTHHFSGSWKGFLTLVEEDYYRKETTSKAAELKLLMKKEVCPDCLGARINSRARDFKVINHSFIEWQQFSISDLSVVLKKQVVIPQSFHEDPLKQKAAQILTGRILNGLDILIHLGLGYLSLGRHAQTLSGGEGQRVRLASVINQDLSGLCIVLDEPTRGLHQKDTDNLIYILQELKRQGNTLVVCEHDPYFINQADHIIELGPGAGTFGGYLIAEGQPTELVNSLKSVTGPYLRSDYSFSRKKRVVNFISSIQIQGATAQNLKKINVRIPTHALVVISGVSGSGKTSLMHDVLYASAKRKQAVQCKQITGLMLFDDFIYVSQKLPKKNFHSRIFDFIDTDGFFVSLFLQGNKSAKKKNYTCAHCKGIGEMITPMDFLSDVYEPCPQCDGTGFAIDILSTSVEGISWALWLSMSINDVYQQVTNNRLKELLYPAIRFGLGYLKLNQRLSTLSGGEWQRLWLMKTVSQQKGKSCLFMIDEPTTGLHMYDVEQLMTVFDQMLDSGHTLLVIEHHPTLIQAADYLIELGPGAGEKGGNVIFQG